MSKQPATEQIAETAQQMLEGSLHYLVGAYRIAMLREEVGAYANDPDFMPFVAILSEIDSLDLSLAPTQWSPTFIAAHREQLDESVEWAKAISLHQCQSLAVRFAS